MTKEFITSEELYYAFIAGAKAIIKQKTLLNKMNVFPVADNDTGTNLSFTMKSIIEEAKLADTPKQTMASIAEAAMLGARGNSGIIFAQFINGLHYELTEEKEISIATFSRVVKAGVNHAYKSISNPVEGTIITVMYDWSKSIDHLKAGVIDVTELFIKSLEAAVQSVNATPEKLKVLKNASVVDAGGKGFVCFLEGMTGYFMSPENNELDFIAAGTEEYEDHVIQVDKNIDVSYRYCTELLLTGRDMDVDAIKHALLSYGDSLIVAGVPTRVKIHMHTNLPEVVFERAKTFGSITQQKVDDMKRQYESVHARKSTIALVTDSIADLPKEIMDKYQIHMIPLNILIGDSSYLDKITISPAYLYERMDDAENYPTSSQPAVKTVENFLKTLVSHYESIIVMTVSSKMSGTYETIGKAAKTIDQMGDKITVIDTKLNSGAQGLVVLKAAEEIAKGAVHKDVVTSIYDTIDKTKIFVSVDTLKYMVRSGRVKKYAGLAANVLNFKPVVSIDKNGKGIVIGNALSVKANTNKMQALVKEMDKAKKIISYSIVHANASERAREFEHTFSTLIGRKPEYITEISSIVAMNAGVGCVAIALTTD